MSYLCLCDVSCERRVEKGSFFAFNCFLFCFPYALNVLAGRQDVSEQCNGRENLEASTRN